VPKSDKIKSRQEWILQDVKKITNALNLLQAKKDEMKEQGLREVEKLLPFLLLGGFTDEETTVYLKAKLEAARQVQEELEKEEQVREEEKEKEDLVEVPIEEEKEEEKKMEAQRAKSIKIPGGAEKTQAEQIKTDDKDKKEEMDVQVEHGQLDNEEKMG
ncbi:MAG: hypothetical protein ACE5FU_08970, partial [Nitrospinota bacterium]